MPALQITTKEIRWLVFCLLFVMVLKRGLLHQGENVDCGVSTKGFWGGKLLMDLHDSLSPLDIIRGKISILTQDICCA